MGQRHIENTKVALVELPLTRAERSWSTTGALILQIKAMADNVFLHVSHSLMYPTDTGLFNPPQSKKQAQLLSPFYREETEATEGSHLSRVAKATSWQNQN